MGGGWKETQMIKPVPLPTFPVAYSGLIIFTDLNCVLLDFQISGTPRSLEISEEHVQGKQKGGFRADFSDQDSVPFLEPLSPRLLKWLCGEWGAGGINRKKGEILECPPEIVSELWQNACPLT